MTRHAGVLVRTALGPLRYLGVLGWISLAVGALVLMPLAAVVSSVLQPGGDAWTHIVRNLLGAYVGNTALLLLGVAAGVTSIGVVTAWLITTYDFPGRRILEWALVLPLAMPAYVMAYAYTDWLQFAGPVQTALRNATGWEGRSYWFPEIRSVGGAALVLSFALYPYVYLIARTAFLDLSRSAVEAGRLAGHSARASFLRVAVPLARPAIAAGVALALMETLADFGTVAYFDLQVFTTGIFKAWFSLGDVTAASQLATCLLGVVVLILAMELASRGRAAYYSAGIKKPRLPHRLRGAHAAGALVVCAAPVLLGFLLPTGILLRIALTDGQALWNARLGGLIGDSFVIASATAVTGVVIATIMAYAARVSKNRLVQLTCRMAALGYAIPGAVIAVGILVPLGRIDNLFARWIESTFGTSPGLILTGTLVALVYAYLVRFLAIALRTVETSLSRITPSMENAARSLGETPLSTLARVHAPLLAPGMLTAGLLVFVDVMKELPATLALRPFGFDTLAVAAHHFAKDERLAEAAVPSLMIVAIGLLPLIFLTRQIVRAGVTHENDVRPHNA